MGKRDTQLPYITCLNSAPNADLATHRFIHTCLSKAYPARLRRCQIDRTFALITYLFSRRLDSTDHRRLLKNFYTVSWHIIRQYFTYVLSHVLLSRSFWMFSLMQMFTLSINLLHYSVNVWMQKKKRIPARRQLHSDHLENIIIVSFLYILSCISRLLAHRTHARPTDTELQTKF